MAQPSTIYRFSIDVSDVDRSYYDTLSLRIACHPSESIDHLLARVVAYALHQPDDIQLTSGLDDSSQPALQAISPIGRLLLWVDIGSPSADRLHRANKAARSVVVYTYKDPARVQAEVAARGVHQAESIALYSFSDGFLDALAKTLGRKNEWSLTRTESQLYVTVGEASITGTLIQHKLT